jgi:hypothetical protein
MKKILSDENSHIDFKSDLIPHQVVMNLNSILKCKDFLLGFFSFDLNSKISKDVPEEDSSSKHHQESIYANRSLDFIDDTVQYLTRGIVQFVCFQNIKFSFLNPLFR